MTKQELLNLWNGFNAKVLDGVYNSDEVLVTIVMLSYIRYESLLRTLDNLSSIFSFKANIALTVQGARRLDADWRKRIEDKCKKFNDYDLVFTEKNHGTGVPRQKTLHRGLKFGTPYIMFTDDDMIFRKGSAEALICMLKQHHDIGGAAVSCNPNYEVHVQNGNWVRPVPISPIKPTFVDAMGSATSIMRREVFDTCDYDPQYYIGFGDFDLCFQIRKAGWRLVVLGFNALKATNTGRDINTPEYVKTRRNKTHINNSRNAFKNKWQGVSIS